MNVVNMFPGSIEEPLIKSPRQVVDANEVSIGNADKMLMITIVDMAGVWQFETVKAGLTNAETLLALELIKRNILEGVSQ